jgi:hypothetical protein
MSATQSPGNALVPGSPAEVAPAPARAGALVPGGTDIDAGVSWPNSAPLNFGIVALVNLVVQGGIMSHLLDPAVGMVGVTGAVAIAGSLVLRSRWRGWRLGRSADRAADFLRAGEQRGQLVRLQGVVQPTGPVLKTTRRHAGVLIRYQGCLGSTRRTGWSSRWRWELHAVDFSVRADDGRELWIDARSIVLLPHPPPRDHEFVHRRRPLYQQVNGRGPEAVSWIYDEEVIAPGDRIEVAGILDLVPHPDVSAGSDRQARLRPILRGTAADPVSVRRHFPTAP